MNAPMDTTKVSVPCRFTPEQRAEMNMTEFYVTRTNRDTASASSKNYVVGLNRNDEGDWQSVLIPKAVVEHFNIRAGSKIWAEFFVNFGNPETSYTKTVLDANGNEVKVSVAKTGTQQIQFTGRFDTEQPVWEELEPADYGI